MSIAMPTLDLGDLGAAIEEAIRDEPGIVAEEAEHTPESVQARAPEVAATDTSQAGATTPDAPDEPAADAGDDFEARFEERYKERYRQDVQQDIAKLQRRLDPQIAERTRERDAANDARTEAEQFAAFLQDQLREYDPDAVERFAQNRRAYVAERTRERELVSREQAIRADRRSSWYATTFQGQIDAQDPELVEAFQRGDHALEKRLLDLKVRELRLARPAPTPEAPKAPATPERNAQGQFVSQAAQKAAETTKREQARGHQPLARGGTPAAAAPPANATAQQLIQFARSQMERGFAQNGWG